MKKRDIHIRDPFLLNDDGVLYMYGSTDENIWGGECYSFSAYKTDDLENFDGPFDVFVRPKDFWSNEQYWAPEVHKYKGKYYLFGSFFKQGTGRKSQILVSDGPLGPFLPFCSPFTPDGWDCLDATLYVENGVPYSVFCHEWVQIVDGTMEAVRLKADLSGPDGNPITLFKASDAPWVRPTSYCGKFDGYITDGPFLRKSKNGKLFMIWSSTAENSQYAVGMAVSESGSVLGPWRHMETPLFGKNGGHASIFEFKGKLLLSLHMPNILSLERAEFFELEEMDDGLKLKGLFESEDKNEK